MGAGAAATLAQGMRAAGDRALACTVAGVVALGASLNKGTYGDPRYVAGMEEEEAVLDGPWAVREKGGQTAAVVRMDTTGGQGRGKIETKELATVAVWVGRAVVPRPMGMEAEERLIETVGA